MAKSQEWVVVEAFGANWSPRVADLFSTENREFHRFCPENRDLSRSLRKINQE